MRRLLSILAFDGLVVPSMLARRFFVGSAVLSLMAVSCSSDDASSPSTTTSATEPTVATTAPTDAPTTTDTATTTAAPDVLTVDPDGIGDAKLGDDPESVVAYFTSVFGPVTSDSTVTGGDLSSCEVDTARFVQWAGLYVVFAPWDPFGAGDMPDMQFVYFSYGHSNGFLPDPLVPTDQGLQIDDSFDRLIELYPSAVAYDGSLGGRFYKVTADGIVGPSGMLDGSPELVLNFESGDWPCADTR